MTKKEALKIAVILLNTHAPAEQAEPVVDTFNKMIEQLSKPRSASSDEAREKAAQKKKEATAKARAELLDAVAPVLRKYLSAPITAKDLFDAAKAELPADFSWHKVQSILIREMAPELNKVEAKGKANTYCLKSA